MGEEAPQGRAPPHRQPLERGQAQEIAPDEPGGPLVVHPPLDQGLEPTDHHVHREGGQAGRDEAVLPREVARAVGDREEPQDDLHHGLGRHRPNRQQAGVAGAVMGEERVVLRVGEGGAGRQGPRQELVHGVHGTSRVGVIAEETETGGQRVTFAI